MLEIQTISQYTGEVNTLIGTSILPQIIRSAILSTRVDCYGTMPVSLFLVAPFEHGKTRLALENASDEAVIVSDVTGIGLLEALQMNPSATTAIINDLSVVVGHRQSVNKLTISVLNALAEEGCYKIAMPKMAHLDLRGRKVNIIACCVPELVADRRNWWYKSGFMSRLLTVRFAHSIELQLAIHKSIQEAQKDGENHALVVPAAMVKVSIDDAHSGLISSIATRLYHAYGEAGYRKHKQIRALAAGHALLRSWKHATVNAEDITFLEKCLPFLIEGSQI